MSTDPKSQQELLQELTEVRARLEEAEETLRAIRSGEVDALVMGEEVYTLKGAETPYRVLIEQMYEGAGTLQDDGTVLYANRRLAELLRIPLQDLIGTSLRRFVVAAELPTFDKLLEESKQCASKGEFNLQRPDGSALSVLLSFSVVYEQDARPICVVATDLTERKRAEVALQQAHDSLEQRVRERTDELQRQREWLSVTLSSIGDALIATDVAGRISFLNPVAETLTGWPQEEALGQPVQTVFQIIDETTRIPGQDIVGRVLREGASIKLANNTCLIDRAGHGIAIEDSAAPIRDQDGKVAGAVLVFHDVTAKRRAVQALRQSEALLRSITDSSPDPIFLKDRDSRMLLANPATLALLQKRAEEVLGKTDEEFYDDPAIGRLMMANDRRVMESGKTELIEEVVPTPGGPHTFLSAKTPYRDAEGHVIGIIGIARDITEGKKTEEALRRVSQRDAFLVVLADALRPLANVNEIKTTAARMLGQHLRASRVAYAEVTPEGDVIVERGYTDGVPDIAGRYRLDDYGPALLPEIRAGRNIVVADVANTPGYTEQEKARYVALQVAANLNVPLLKNGRPVALLAVHQAVPRQWTDEEILLVRETVERTWATVERARAEQSLQASYDDLERFNQAMVGRELRMIELKKEIDELCGQFGQPLRYYPKTEP